jgi:hypothetical protein
VQARPASQNARSFIISSSLAGRMRFFCKSTRLTGKADFIAMFDMLGQPNGRHSGVHPQERRKRVPEEGLNTASNVTGPDSQAHIIAGPKGLGWL